MNIYFDMDGVLADFEASVRMIPRYTPGLNKSSKNMSYQERIAKAKNFLAIEKIIPPFGVPSSFVIARAEISTASLKTRA